MNKISLSIVAVIIVGIIGFFLINRDKNASSKTNTTDHQALLEDEGGIQEPEVTHPLQITELRKQKFPGSDLVIEETLTPGSNYNRYIASYKSENLKIYGLLTVPQGEKPGNGWPVIIFNHGFIPPAEYRTTERYIAYTDAFSRNGYLLFRPDYRGHGSSEGVASGGYGSNDYTIDVLNALSSVKKYKDADPNRVGMWGHSMGGYITLRSMVVDKEIKAGVIWAGVVASYPDLIYNWRRSNSATPTIAGGRRGWRQSLIEEFGDPQKNIAFWNSISANSYLTDLGGPIQIHHGTADTSVPVKFSETLHEQMKAAGQESELFIYPGDEHNISSNLYIALQRSVEFFDKHVKGT